MLEPADTIVVQRDTRLTELRTLLDQEAFADTLRRLCPDRTILAATARYVRYKPQTSCLVAYEVVLGEGERINVYARCHADDGPSKIGNVSHLLHVPSALGPGLLADPDEGLAIFAYPNDYEVRGLRKLHELERTYWRLRRIVPAHPHLFTSVPETLRYKPERRYVGRLAGEGGPPVAIRLYTDALFEGARERAWAFRSDADLRVPRIVGDSSRYNALALEWMDGTPLTQLLAATEDPTRLAGRAGEALAGLHRQRPRLGTMYSADDYCRAVSSACRALEAISPALGRRALACCATVQEIIQGRRWRSKAIHGDFTPDQALVGESHLTVLDFDRAGYGDPGMDLGAFTAGAIATALDGNMTMTGAAQCAAALADAYQRAGGAGGDDPVFAAGALLMMAPEPFRQRRSGWDEIVGGLLDRAERTLQRESIDA